MPAADGKPKIKVGEGKGNTQHKLPQLNQTRTKPQWSLTNPPFTLLGDMPNIQQKNVDNTQSNSHKLTGTMKKAMRLTHKEVQKGSIMARVSWENFFSFEKVLIFSNFFSKC